ncbi:hypothetical protein Tco_1355893 [Tanacetum coccineum]
MGGARRECHIDIDECSTLHIHWGTLEDTIANRLKFYSRDHDSVSLARLKILSGFIMLGTFPNPGAFKSEKDKLISNLKTIQDYLCSFKSQGLTTFAHISATTFPQTLDWLHNHLLQCIEQGISSASKGSNDKTGGS